MGNLVIETALWVMEKTVIVNRYFKILWVIYKRKGIIKRSLNKRLFQRGKSAWKIFFEGE